MSFSKMQISYSSILLIVLLSVFRSSPIEAQLQVGFYDYSCPSAEAIVKEEVQSAFATNTGIAAGLVRLYFHDCFVRGCDASVLIDSTENNKAEKDSPVNFPSLRGFEVIDSAKKRIEARCKGIVSCADILAFAARDSVKITQGMPYDVPAGRRDGRVSIAQETFSNLPGPFLKVDQLTQMFAGKGFTQEEMVILSGSHTLGRAHCTTITRVDNRLYGFNTTNGSDPTMDSAYATELQQQCPQESTDGSSTVSMDPTPSLTDTKYYSNIVANKGLLTSDQTLLSNPSTASLVNQYATDKKKLWIKAFSAAMVKMGNMGVLTGTDGEIRSDCRIINTAGSSY